MACASLPSDQHSPHLSNEEIRAQKGERVSSVAQPTPPQVKAHLSVASLVQSSLRRHLGINHKKAGVVSSPPTSGAEQTFPRKFSKTILSFPLASGKSWWSQARRKIVPEISAACFQQRQFPHWEESSRYYCRDSNHGGVQGGPLQGRGVTSIRMVCLRRKGICPLFLDCPPPQCPCGPSPLS